MHVSTHFEFFDGLFQRHNPWYKGGKFNKEEGDSNWKHLFRKFWDIREGATLRRLILLQKL